ncbi:unnamed protein product [Malus baccata var. baccata]
MTEIEEEAHACRELYMVAYLISVVFFFPYFLFLCFAFAASSSSPFWFLFSCFISSDIFSLSLALLKIPQQYLELEAFALLGFFPITQRAERFSLFIFFSSNFFRDRIRELEVSLVREGLISRTQKAEMYKKHKENPEVYTVERLAKDYRIMRQREEEKKKENEMLYQEFVQRMNFNKMKVSSIILTFP